LLFGDENEMPNEKRKPTNQGIQKNLIKCECGKEILIVPDVDAMSRAIEAHVWEHLKEEKNPRKAAYESNRLWDLLVAATFSKAFVA